MTIPAIGSVSSIGGVSAPTAPAAPADTDGSGFAAALTGAVDDMQGLQATSNDLAIKAVTGNLDDIHDATIAATRAQVTVELAAAVRNKAVDAFTEIMRMQA